MPDNISLSRKLQLTFDLRIVSAALLVIIVAMILIWKPWSSGGASGRTVEVTGENELSYSVTVTYFIK